MTNYLTFLAMVAPFLLFTMAVCAYVECSTYKALKAADRKYAAMAKEALQ